MTNIYNIGHVGKVLMYVYLYLQYNGTLLIVPQYNNTLKYSRHLLKKIPPRLTWGLKLWGFFFHIIVIQYNKHIKNTKKNVFRKYIITKYFIRHNIIGMKIMECKHHFSPFNIISFLRLAYMYYKLSLRCNQTFLQGQTNSKDITSSKIMFYD